MVQIQELKLLETHKNSDSGEEMVLNSARNWRRSRKRKKERHPDEAEAEKVNNGGSDVRRDPLEVLGRDIMLIILNNLDARSMALSLVVSRGWHGVACSDKLWSPKCEELWMGKAHIPRLSQIRGISKVDAYSLSIMDGKRTRIRKEDLCDHAWEFHFNKTAPEYWRDLDPYWKGTGPPLRRYFHPDGSQTADSDDAVWGGHEGCFSVVTSFVGDGKIRAHYVRINRWPQMSVSRKSDWGWEMSNHICCYSSIPDAKKEGGTGPLFLFV